MGENFGWKKEWVKKKYGWNFVKSMGEKSMGEKKVWVKKVWVKKKYGWKICKKYGWKKSMGEKSMGEKKYGWKICKKYGCKIGVNVCVGKKTGENLGVSWPACRLTLGVNFGRL